MTTTPNLYTLDQIEKATGAENFDNDLIEAIRKGFVALEGGEFFACPIQTMGLPPFPFVEGVEGYAAQTCVKSGYFKGGKYYVIKVASGGHPIPNSGLMQVYSQTTGRLEALLLDNGILTEIRTAAIGALAARLLAPPDMRQIGICGTGIQARYQLGMLKNVTQCRKVLVLGRSPDKAKAFQNEMIKKGWDVSIANSADQLLVDCDLIVTTTCSREAIIGHHGNVDELVKIRNGRGLHITCIGADAPGKFELHPDLVQKADLLVADTVAQSIERGEFQKVVTDKLVDKSSILSLGTLIGEQDSRKRKSSVNDGEDNRFTIFDSSGVALQDCIVAEMAYETLKKGV